MLGFPLIAPDPSPYHAIKAGEEFFRPPHRLECVTCKKTADVFDVRIHGYNAVLNDWSGYESGTEDEGRAPNEYKIIVSFVYNIDHSEISDLAKEAGVEISDLFDWIEIEGSPVREGEPIQWSYECA